MNWVGVSCYEGACPLVRCDHGIIIILGRGRSLLVGDSHWSTYEGNETVSGICLKYSNDVLRHSAMSDSLWPHVLQHTRLLHPSLPPRVCLNSCPLSQWFNPTISTSVAPFSSCPQSFLESGSFPMSQLLAAGSQSNSLVKYFSYPYMSGYSSSN